MPHTGIIVQKMLSSFEFKGKTSQCSDSARCVCCAAQAIHVLKGGQTLKKCWKSCHQLKTSANDFSPLIRSHESFAGPMTSLLRESVDQLTTHKCRHLDDQKDCQ